MTLVSNERTEWLQSLCSSWTPAIAEPFTATLGAVKMIGATNGHGMTLLRAQDDEDAPPFGRAHESLDLLDGAEWRAIQISDLETWAMRYRARCLACGGAGFQKMVGYAAFGPEGEGPEHDVWQKCECDNPGIIEGVPINKRLLLRYFAVLSAPTVEIAKAPTASMFAVRAPSSLGGGAPDWMVLIMGVKTETGIENFDPFPEKRPSGGQP